MRLPAAQRREQLLAAAIEIFATEGYHESSMNSIAEAAGVTKPVLYQHFDSKRELYLEVLSEIGTRVREVIQKATADADGPRQQIEFGFRAYFGFIAANSSAYTVLFGSGTLVDPEFVLEARKVEASLAELVADRIKIEHLSAQRRLVLGHGIVGLAEGACRYWQANKVNVEPDTLASEVTELAWAGLRGIN